MKLRFLSSSGFNIETAALLPDLFSVSAEAVAEHLKS